jgi:hypothetical protein
VKDEDVMKLASIKQEFLDQLQFLKAAPWSMSVSEEASNDLGTLIFCHCP